MKSKEWLRYVIDGGARKYRVRHIAYGKFEVQMKGGGVGPFWGFACLSHFDTLAEAELAMARMIKNDC